MNAQITIYYHPEINKHKKTIAHAKSIGDVLAISFDQIPTANNIWMKVYQNLEKPAAVFESDWYARQAFAENNFENWHKLVIKNPDKIESPIAIKGEEVIICHRQTQVYDLMEKAV